MSFGPKLDDLPVEVPPGDEALVTLELTPADTDFRQHAIIYVEEAAGLRSIQITAKSPPSGSTDHEQSPSPP